MSKPSTSSWFHNVEIFVRLPLLTLLPFTLYRCPFCNFPALLDKDMSLFSCPNPRCRKVSPLSTRSPRAATYAPVLLHIYPYHLILCRSFLTMCDRDIVATWREHGWWSKWVCEGCLMNCFMAVMKWFHLERSPPPSPSVLSRGLLPLSEECRGEALRLPRPSHGSQTKKSIICQKRSHT